MQAQKGLMSTLAVSLLLTVTLVACPQPAPEAPVEEPGPPTPVMMVRFGPDMVISLGCVIDGLPDNGRECLEQVPDDTPFWVEDIGKATVAQRVGAACENGPARGPAISMEPQGDEPLAIPSGPTPAIHPLELRKRLTTYSRTEVAQLTPEEEAALQAITLELVDSGEMEAHQKVETDVDGDGEVDAIYAISVPQMAEMPFLVSALVFAPSGELGRLKVIHQSNELLYRIQGTIDLDDNGAHEVWIHAVGPDRTADYLESWGEAKTQVIGKWEC